MHKRRPLLKPMMIVSTTGYIVSVLGPYLADPKNNNSSILNHSIHSNTEEIKNWVEEGDIFVVDRGFRDSEAVLNDLGIRMEMPAFIPKGQRQLSAEEANSSRLVTKVRWVMESVNGRVKTWRYSGKTLPNVQIPYIGDYLRIVCGLCNKYRPQSTLDSIRDLQDGLQLTLTPTPYENNAGCESLEIQNWTEEVDDTVRAIDSSEDEEILDFEREEE
uniref:Uncharacterized protein LOC111114116 n=1 Tax=Crassostrea virginica TaxID=6565 RepID=A0A8B8BXK3_CRAVI|nr:uncharacterized protein LOC111114116 [Crassostrea virginica]